jgi:hypothetical protein
MLPKRSMGPRFLSMVEARNGFVRPRSVFRFGLPTEM